MLKMDRRPLYVKAAEKIVEYLSGQGLSVGDELPSEFALANLLGISRSTVREALRSLELLGRIKRVPGRKSVVAEVSPILYGLNTLESLESITRGQGWVCETKNVVIATAPLPESAARFFQLPCGTPSTHLVRVKTKDGRAFCHMTSWMPPAVLSVEELQRLFHGSIGELLLADENPKLDYAVAEVGATAADEAMSEELGVASGSPLVVLTERFYQNPARPICYSVNVYVPASVRLEVVRRPSPFSKERLAPDGVFDVLLPGARG